MIFKGRKANSERTMSVRQFTHIPNWPFGAKEADFYVLKLIQPRLTMSRPLSHRRMNLRVDSCLDVPHWDCCPQQTLLILLHGHLAASMCTHMAGWHRAYWQASWIVSPGPRCQANMVWSHCLLNYVASFSETNLFLLMTSRFQAIYLLTFCCFLYHLDTWSVKITKERRRMISPAITKQIVHETVTDTAGLSPMALLSVNSQILCSPAWRLNEELLYIPWQWDWPFNFFFFLNGFTKVGTVAFM